MRMTAVVLAGLLAVMLGMALLGDTWKPAPCNEVKPLLRPGSVPGGPLFVLVHGFDPDRKEWNAVAQSLVPHGDVLELRYDAGRTSNAQPAEVARNIGAAIAAEVAKGGRTDVVVVAHSMGALLARRALLDALKDKQAWAVSVKRLVLLAGMNRGWTAEGRLPPDASAWLEVEMRVGHWLAGMLRKGQLLLDLQRGSPFVSDLRLEWMRSMREALAAAKDGAGQAGGLEVVQLLGDIDDFVSREDNEDLRTTAMGQFALLRVRGTGHGDIIDFHKDGSGGEQNLGDYRRNKLLLAATGKFSQVQADSEVLEPPVDMAVTDIVFVLHGIRDIGRWSSTFEEAVKQENLLPAGRKLLFVSPRYGYLGMGPFLFESVRDRYVRWFMDEYTETLARYPNVQTQNIRFFGHSNGTYLLADALRKYKSMRVGNVVLAGSVVAREYDWTCLADRIGSIRSYAGTRDLVVAWFPRLFELPGFAWLGNRLGGGGFHGFKDARVDNVLVEGGHGAFDGHEAEIVHFLMRNGQPRPLYLAAPGPGDDWKQDRSLPDRALASTPLVLLVWAGLVALVGYLGFRVVGAAAAPSWPVFVLFVLLVVTVLRTV